MSAGARVLRTDGFNVVVRIDVYVSEIDRHHEGGDTWRAIEDAVSVCASMAGAMGDGNLANQDPCDHDETEVDIIDRRGVKIATVSVSVAPC
jgi:hypothetical protein